MLAEPIIADPRPVRQSRYPEHPIFHMNRAESEMTRYMRRLSDKDLALDRAMIPLGSCTMKLNATAEMLPITWPEFATSTRSRPPTRRGRLQADDRRSGTSCARSPAIDAMSMQPNSGAQGEYAGLLTIRSATRVRAATAIAHLPDPDLGAWHQPGLGADGRHDRRRGEMHARTATSTSTISAPRPSSMRTGSPPA
jgi:hypothetical protein